jgi:hypothetical protein
MGNVRNTQNLIALSTLAVFACCTVALHQTAANAGTEPAATPTPDKSAATAATAQVLPSEQFFGEAQAAYEAAKECPDLIANLFCYCGCDVTDHHSSLLDCFTSNHSADCTICQEEVFIGLGMKKQGKTLAEIQRAIDEKFQSEYPFDKPSANLLKYRAARKWQPAPEATKADTGKHAAEAATPQLKPGKKAGDCCGGKNHSASSVTKS